MKSLDQNASNQHALDLLRLYVGGGIAELDFEAFLLFFNEKTQAKFRALSPDLIRDVEKRLGAVIRRYDENEGIYHFYIVDFPRDPADYDCISLCSYICRFFTYDPKKRLIKPCKEYWHTFEHGASFYKSDIVVMTIYKEIDEFYDVIFDESIPDYDYIKI